MKRLLLAASVLGALLGAPAQARTVEEQVLTSLVDQGYTIIEHGYTFLGRLRIVAVNEEFQREIVVNPGTGEVLRDYAFSLPRGVAGASPASPSSSGKRPSVAVAAGDPAVAPPDVAVTSGAGVTMSLGVGRADGVPTTTDRATADVVLPESLLQMDLGAP
jgi:hypothetical protein